MPFGSLNICAHNFSGYNGAFEGSRRLMNLQMFAVVGHIFCPIWTNDRSSSSPVTTVVFHTLSVILSLYLFCLLYLIATLFLQKIVIGPFCCLGQPHCILIVILCCYIFQNSFYILYSFIDDRRRDLPSTFIYGKQNKSITREILILDMWFRE